MVDWSLNGWMDGWMDRTIDVDDGDGGVALRKMEKWKIGK